VPFNSNVSQIDKTFFSDGDKVLGSRIFHDVSGRCSLYHYTDSESVFMKLFCANLIEVVPEGTELSSFISPISGEVVDSVNVGKVVHIGVFSDMNEGRYYSLNSWLSSGEIKVDPDIKNFVEVAREVLGSFQIGTTFVFKQEEVFELFNLIRVFVSKE
jgi:hypothetical protein